MSRQTGLAVELLFVAILGFLWLGQPQSFSDWWHFLSVAFLLFIAFVCTSKLALSSQGLMIASFLLTLGWVFILRINPDLSAMHLRGTILGIIVYILALMVDWHDFKHKYISGLLVLILLLLTWIFGDVSGGAKAWLNLGIVRFQPIEIARIALLLFLAGYFHDHSKLLRHNQAWPQLRYWGPLFLLMCGVFLFLVIQRDLGPALVFFFVFVSLVFYTSFNWHALLIYPLIAIGGVIIAWFAFGHIRERVLIWLNPWQYATGSGFQIVQGLFALNNGGVFGRGIKQGLGIGIPALHTDYLFALIGEELGFIGATVVLASYFLLLFVGLKIAHKLGGKSHILAISIVLLWGYQVFIVIGGILKVIPLSGMTLPFISYGGTSMVANFGLLGILTKLSSPQSEQLKSTRTKPIFVLLIILFTILWGALIYWQFLRPDLRVRPNNPLVLAGFNRPRGNIYDRNGILLVGTEYEGESYQRYYYGDPSFSHSIGYFDSRYGITGLEAKYDRQLGNKQDLYLTLDAHLQAIVAKAMGTRVGAVVVMAPTTGELLALYSAPFVDSNALAINWQKYQEDVKSPFFNRVLHGVYPPGSVIKPLLLAAAYEERVTTAESVWIDQGIISFGNRRISNFNQVAHGNITTQEALSLSSNVVFSQIAIQLKSAGLSYLDAFGIPTEQLATERSDFGWSQLGIGQGDLTVRPLDLAVAISVIANRGTKMEPHMVKSLTGNLLTRRINRPRIAGEIISGHTAALIREAMLATVSSGTGQGAQITNLRIAGKTGTAENAHGEDHSWFVGFLPADDPKMVIVVVVEHGGFGGGVATEIARKIMFESQDMF